MCLKLLYLIEDSIKTVSVELELGKEMQAPVYSTEYNNVQYKVETTESIKTKSGDTGLAKTGFPLNMSAINAN